LAAPRTLFGLSTKMAETRTLPREIAGLTLDRI
jgi:hypothetical protein